MRTAALFFCTFLFSGYVVSVKIIKWQLHSFIDINLKKGITFYAVAIFLAYFFLKCSIIVYIVIQFGQITKKCKKLW